MELERTLQRFGATAIEKMGVGGGGSSVKSIIFNPSDALIASKLKSDLSLLRSFKLRPNGKHAQGLITIQVN